MTGFSVIIPTCNRPKFLTTAVASVFAQSELPDEVIVVDDGEGAGKSLGNLAPKVHVLDNNRRGPVAARRLGVARATSEFIAFLDDDDWWSEPRYLQLAAARFGDGADLCFGDGNLVDAQGGYSIAYSLGADAWSLERDNTILVSAASYRRALHESLGGFDGDLPYYWDWDWYLRVARSGARLAHIMTPVAAIRVHPENMSGEAQQQERRRNLDRFAAKHRLPPLTLKNHVSLVRQPAGIGGGRRCKRLEENVAPAAPHSSSARDSPPGDKYSRAVEPEADGGNDEQDSRHCPHEG